MPRRETRTISLRIDSDIERILHEDSQDKGLTLNSLSNQIFKKYAEWDRYAEKMGMIPISKDVIRHLLDILSDEQVEQVGKEMGGFIPREMVSILFGDANFTSLMGFLRVWFRRFSSFEHHFDGRQHTFVIYHDINMKYSFFLGGFIDAAARDLAERSAKIKHTPNSISVTLVEMK